MRCTKCGNEINQGEKFCGNCGAKVHEETLLNNKPIDKNTPIKPKQDNKKKNIKITLYIIWLIICCIAIINNFKGYSSADWITILLFSVLSPLIINWIVKSEKRLITKMKRKNKNKTKAKTKNKKDTNKKDPNVVLKHIAGLPVANNIECKLTLRPDKIEFDSSGYKFNLDKSKISDVSIKTDVEIQKQISSSVGGAVGGAVLFGPLGAMIGGRAKERKSTTSKNYLIFTYPKDQEIKYISFELYQIYQLRTAQKFVDDFKARNTAVNEVNL